MPRIPLKVSDTSDNDSSSDDDDGLAVLAPPLVSFEGDTYSLTISTWVRDAHTLAKGSKSKAVIISRFILSFSLFIVTITMQVFLLIQVKHWVSSKAVHDVRNAYSVYEFTMYGPAAECLTKSPHGHYRGRQEVDGCFKPGNFDLLTDDEKKGACRISLSQPYFIFVILLMWAILCISELKKVKARFLCLIVNCKRINSMVDAFDGKVEGEEDEVVIQGLTVKMKAAITVFCFVPRILMTTYLLWVGSRWLLATNTFSDLILNAVALEFILLVKEMIYVAMAPQRYQTELEKTKMLPQEMTNDASVLQLAEVFFWFGLSVGWVFLYMIYLQDVVSPFQWDVHDMCIAYLDKRYSV